MKYEVKTKQGKNYIVSDESAWLWIELERGLGLTMKQAITKMAEGSLDVITWLLHRAALDAKHTDIKTQKVWVETEFDSFEVLEDDPKATKTEA
ncbi:MAG: hypothetical protein ACO24H_10540 [Polynucleobacter sp.]